MGVAVPRTRADFPGTLVSLKLWGGVYLGQHQDSRYNNSGNSEL